jgi:hypothetical protein
MAKITEKFARALFKAVLVWSSVTLVAILFATRVKPEPFALSILIVVTFAALGCLIGFVMGIPKPEGDDEQAVVAGLSGADAAVIRLAYNNSVARISTAFTTLLIGLSLAQFGKILDGLGWLGTKYETVFSETLFGQPTARSAYGLALTLSAVILGFMFMFMWTSTRLLAVLRENN